MTSPIEITQSPAGPESAMYVDDPDTAYELALNEDAAHQQLEAAGLADLGSDYFRVTLSSGTVHEGNGREAFGACSYLGALARMGPGGAAAVRSAFAVMRVDSRPRPQEAPAITENLG